MRGVKGKADIKICSKKRQIFEKVTYCIQALFSILKMIASISCLVPLKALSFIVSSVVRWSENKIMSVRYIPMITEFQIEMPLFDVKCTNKFRY